MAGQKYLNPLLHCCIALYWVSTSVDIKHSGWSGNNYSETAGMWHQGVGGTVILVILKLVVAEPEPRRVFFVRFGVGGSIR